MNKSTRNLRPESNPTNLYISACSWLHIYNLNPNHFRISKQCTLQLCLRRFLKSSSTNAQNYSEIKHTEQWKCIKHKSLSTYKTPLISSNKFSQQPNKKNFKKEKKRKTLIEKTRTFHRRLREKQRVA